jgi:diphosphomevalonate decarboxylase
MSMTFGWQSPSNIALVKYWGKRDPQLPSNPSISFTLDTCHTQTRATFETGHGVQVLLNGVDTPSFVPKIEQFIGRIQHRHPWLADYRVTVDTFNSFPHSSGIASSASGLSALALCVVDAAQALGHAPPGGRCATRGVDFGPIGFRVSEPLCVRWPRRLGRDPFRSGKPR